MTGLEDVGRLFRRGLLRALPVLAAAAAPAEAPGEGSPSDLDWLRGEVGDGALVHHADGRIYLTELLTGETVHVGNGDQPEFSPDGAKFAWIDGDAAKGRMRRGDPAVHVIARGVAREGGVHWLSNDEVAVVLREGGDRRWFRVSLDGGRSEIPELTALGTGGYESDVRQAEDGVWSYVADEVWRTSDGRSGRVAGTCSVSLSPDGRSVTSLHDDHRTAFVQAIRAGGAERTLRWRHDGGFDNHRWASNADYIVVVDEVHQESRDVTYPVVMSADGERSTRLGNRGFARHGVYGDFTVGEGGGRGWLSD